VVHLLKQACSALGDAHGRGVVHRDIKPGNIMVCERGGVWDVVKVLDFGIARPFAVEAAAGRSRLSGPDYVRHFEGTPAYMSPEQAAGAAPTPASDIYSLGATAYFMLTGEAFRRPGVDATIRAHLAESPVAPMDLQDIVLRCLEKDVARRFPDVGQLEKALANCQCAGSWDNEKAMRWWGELKTRFTGAHEGREEEKRRE
jgi:serine/threonine-protein kinase